MNIAAIGIVTTTLLMGLVAGFFHAFSNTVMGALDQCDPRAAVAAMRRINGVVINPLFLGPFFVAPLIAWATASLLLAEGARTSAIWLTVAGLAHALGAILPTMIVNVPLNLTLDRAGAADDGDAARAMWQAYAPRWTRWNSVRTVFCFVGLAATAIGALCWR